MTDKNVFSALRALLIQMDTLEDALANSSTSTVKKQEAKTLYADLKKDLRTAAAYGTTDGKKRQKTEGEEHFYHPAVRRALAYLTPAINSDPQRADWYSAIQDARGELEPMLRQLSESGG